MPVNLYFDPINAPVGLNAEPIGGNRRKDVRIVQELLAKIPPTAGGPRPDLKEGLDPPSEFVTPKTVEAIFEFQDHHFGCSNGRVYPDDVTLTKLREEAWRNDQPGKRGAPPPGGPRAFPKAVTMARIMTLRDRYVQLAMEYNGAVSDEKGADGHRHGWKTLKAIYQETLEDWQAINAPDSNFQKAGLVVGPVQWCGVFATWVLRQVHAEFRTGLEIKWRRWSKSDSGGMLANGVPLPYFHLSGGHPALAKFIRKGDVCVTSLANSHHVIAVTDPAGGVFEAIEGNQMYGSGHELCSEAGKNKPDHNKCTPVFKRHIVLKQRSVAEVVAYWAPFRPPRM